MVEGGGIITMGDANLPREMARPEWLKGQGRGEESLCLGDRRGWVSHRWPRTTGDDVFLSTI